MTRSLPLGALLLLLAPSVYAGQKLGQALEVPQDQLGASGKTGLSSEGGFRLSHTVGAGFSGTRMQGASGRGASPGLWGGSFFQPSGSSSLISFGDPSAPARLEVPAGALPRDWVVFASDNPLTRPLAVSPAVIRQAEENLAKSRSSLTRPVGNRLWEILVLDEAGTRVDGRLAAPAALTLPYPDDDNDGIVDGTSPPARAADMSVWWLDEAHSLWVRLPDSRVDAAAKTVSAPIRHFSVYSVMGAPSFDPSEAYAFPVPWRPFGPDAGAGAGQTGTSSGGITFTNLPSAARIRIYTLAGSLVKEIAHADGTPQSVWDARNDAGEDVATGTYVYVIESGGNRKRGKLVIIR